MQNTPLLAPTFVLPHPEFYFLEQQSSAFTVNWVHNAVSASFVQGTSSEMQQDLCADACVCVLLESCAFASLEFKDTEYLSNFGST